MNENFLERWYIYEIESPCPQSAKGATRAFQRILVKSKPAKGRYIVDVNIPKSESIGLKGMWFGVNIKDLTHEIGHWRYPLPTINKVVWCNNWLYFAEQSMPHFYAEIVR